MAAQLIGGSSLSPVEVVDRAVALQGQDLSAVLRAIAMRSRPGTTLDDVRAAFDRGELVRSWPVRGTLFATTPAHLASLLSLTGERVHRATGRRREQRGLDDATLARAREVALTALTKGPLVRSEVLALWTDAGIDTSNGRGYHLIFHHAIAGDWHWGPFRGDEQALVATPPRELPEGDPLPGIVAGLATARGPVTTEDLAWWLKLPKTAVRQAASAAGLESVEVDGVAAWIAPDVADDASDAPEVAFVPGFDEWILGYEDRSLTAGPEVQRALVPGNNGVFRPAVLVDGVTVGTWLGRAKGRREPTFELVEKVPAATRKRIAAALAAHPYA